jgi:cytochrome d ubiquinol oxidase subunit II
MSALQVIWFLLIGFLFTGYAVLDGFDLGVGFWHLFVKKDSERRTLLNAIGPVWDGNEVWLLTGGGALFAAFPHVYATVFSGMYLALILVLLALVFRAVSVEFRSKEPSRRWRNSWDVAFSLGSIVPALLFGVALGNVMRGLPLGDDWSFTGTFFTLLNPYALLIGLVGFAMLITHGALYIVLKTDGGLAARARRWAQASWWFYTLLFLIATLATALTQPHLLENYLRFPLLWLLPIAVLTVIVLTGVFNNRGQFAMAFAFSALSVIGCMSLITASLFPRIVPALGRPEMSLTVGNASSSQLTLLTMLILALIGMPLVIGYTVWAYRALGGKAETPGNGY